MGSYHQLRIPPSSSIIQVDSQASAVIVRIFRELVVIAKIVDKNDAGEIQCPSYLSVFLPSGLSVFQQDATAFPGLLPPYLD